MRLMLIGTDRSVFAAGSPARDRLTLFAKKEIDSLDTIVFSTRTHQTDAVQVLSPNVRAFGTNSSSRLFYGLDALRVAKALPRPDVVSAQDPFETGLAALLIARHFRVPLVIEMHTDFVATSFARHSFLNRIRLLIARYVLPRAKGGYAVSKRVRDAVVDRYRLSAPFAVLPVYVDTSRFAALARAPRKGNVLWIGRFAPEKRPMHAVDAVIRARALGHDIHLTMLGAGPLEPVLRARAEIHGSSITFVGWTDPAKHLSFAELVLSTSEYEGYGMAVVEALAAGVPVLSTDTGIARDAGAIIADGDFGDALLKWLEGPRARGLLKLTTYRDSDEYASRVRAFYRAFVSP